MKKIALIFLTLIMLVACGPEEVPRVADTTMATPAPGVDPSTVEEMVVTSVDDDNDADDTEPETTMTAPPVKEFTVRAFQFSYDPNVIEVNKGDRVIIHGYSEDVAHSFTIREFGVDLALVGETPVTTEFIADKAGTFTIRCTVPCGRGHGNMRGTLIVNE